MIPQNELSHQNLYLFRGILCADPWSEYAVQVYLRHGKIRRMAENGFAPSPREFRRHILSCRELKAESFKKCLHSVRWGVSL